MCSPNNVGVKYDPATRFPISESVGYGAISPAILCIFCFNALPVPILHIVNVSNMSNPSKEDSPYKPSSPYSSSKASTDLVATSFNETFDTNLTIVNLCNNYGPYQYLEKFIPTCIFSLIRNQSIPIYGKGVNIREWMYVDDACKAILELFQKLDKYLLLGKITIKLVGNYMIIFFLSFLKPQVLLEK